MIDENHLPIISKEIFEKVQDEKERRALLKGNLVGDRHKYSSKYPFSAKVFCGDCGNIFKRRHWNSTNALLEEFDEQIFDALVEKIEILTSTHFVFELKSGMKVEEIEE